MIEYPILIGTIVLLSITIIAKLTVRDFKINKHYDTYGRVILWIYLYSLVQEVILLITK